MHRFTRGVVLTALLAAIPAVASADQQTPDPPVSATPDFFFGRPHGSVGIRGGWLFARADSDLFDFVQRHLTVDKQDFNMPAVGFDVAFAVSPRVDITAGADFSKASKRSEYRDFIDNRSLPIEQDTSLKEWLLSGSIRFSLTPRGRGVSRYAWVPRTFTPYVGAGGGALWYKFEQDGDFVDFVDSRVFTDYFSSKGFAPSAHVFGGTDIRVYRALYLGVEGRYVWANAKLGRDFIDFDPIDLTGFRLSTGLNLVF
jgi:hypothetical protein